MRCKQCDYPLWGLESRTCPECGTGFRPSEFDLVPNSIRFLCPHCRQPYYGTTERGHLDPSTFDCVRCGTAIEMDAMVLEPREGVHEDRTQQAINPWLNRQRLSTRKAFWKTLGMSMGTPARLARCTPIESSGTRAFGFFAVVIAIVSVLGMLPIVALMIAGMVAGLGSGGGSLLGAMSVGVGMVLLIPPLLLVVAFFAWGLVTQVLLVFLAAGPTRMGSTYKSVAYGAGPVVVGAIPCLGMHTLPVGVVWWGVSSAIMMATMHRIAWWRAALAHGLAGVLVFGVPIGGLVWLSRSGATFGSQASAAQISARNLQSHLALRTGPPSQHFHCMDVLPQPWLPSDLEWLSTETITPMDVFIAGHPLHSFATLSPQVRAPIEADLRAGMLPSGVHRVGHVVLTYNGVDLSTPQGPDLWIAIVWPDPDDPNAGFASPPTVAVVLASGVVQDYDLASFPAALAQQNADRRALGIPEIEDPATVRMWPPGSAYGPGGSAVPVP